MSKKIAAVFSLLLNSLRTLVFSFDIAYIVFLCFLKPNCLPYIYFFYSRYQTSLFFVILSNILHSILVRAIGLYLLTSFEPFPSFYMVVIVANFNFSGTISSSQILLYSSSRHFNVSGGSFFII